MHSPPIEWTLFVGNLAVVDYIRSRGEADHDTLSEVVRNMVEKIPHGEALFTIAVFSGAVWLRRHIIRPLRT